MKYLSVALIYIAFCALLGIAIWITKSPWCLLAISLFPSYKEKGGNENKDK